MALRPEDLKLTPEEVNLANQYEEVIDAGLREQYFASKNQYVVDVYKVQKGGTISVRVASEVIRRYKEAGWSDARVDNGQSKVILTKIHSA